MPNRTRTAAALAAVALLVAACGRLNETGAGSEGIAHPTGSDDLVLRVDVGGGFLPVESTLSALPSLSIYGDGRMIVPGPQIEIYPGPALPSLVVTRLTEDAVQAILEAAREAGLMGGDASYGYDCIADAPTTTFTLNAEGRSNVVSAYALGLEGGGGCPDVDEQARARLSAFWTSLGDLPSVVPGGSVGPEAPYEPTELRVFVLPYRGDPELPQEPRTWPLERPLEAFGEPSSGLEDARCGVVSGEDLASTLDAAASANQLTPWTSGGNEHLLLFRPLLPDEHGC